MENDKQVAIKQKAIEGELVDKCDRFHLTCTCPNVIIGVATSDSKDGLVTIKMSGN